MSKERRTNPEDEHIRNIGELCDLIEAIWLSGSLKGDWREAIPANEVEARIAALCETLAVDIPRNASEAQILSTRLHEQFERLRPPYSGPLNGMPS